MRGDAEVTSLSGDEVLGVLLGRHKPVIHGRVQRKSRPGYAGVSM